MDQDAALASLDQITSENQYATFFVDSLFFGIEVIKVQEVLRYQQITAVPLAPDVIQGLINLRGQIVTAIDLRRRLRLAPRAPETLPMNVVVRGEESAVSLLVDEIGEVIEVSNSAFEPPPVNMPAAQRTLINGVYKLEGRLLLILNTERTVQPE